MATSLSKQFFPLFLIVGLIVTAVFGRSWIETDECVSACGLDRKTISISSDSLLDRQFMHRLCSPECYMNCPNTIDLYFSVAAGEGVFLPNLCRANGFRRKMSEKPNDDHVIYLSPAPGKLE